MKIKDLIIGNEYEKVLPYGQPVAIVKVTDIDVVRNRVFIEDVSDGFNTWFNELECERYLHDQNHQTN